MYLSSPRGPRGGLLYRQYVSSNLDQQGSHIIVRDLHAHRHGLPHDHYIETICTLFFIVRSNASASGEVKKIYINIATGTGARPRDQLRVFQKTHLTIHHRCFF